MKLFARIAVLLAAALVVAGALLAFGRSGYAETMRTAGSGRERAGFEQEGLPQGGAPPAGRPQGEGDRHGPSLFGLVELGKNLITVGVIVSLVAIGARLLALARARVRREPPPPAAPTTGETTQL